MILALVGGCSATKPAAGRATTPSPSPSVSASTALPPTGGAASQATPAPRPPIVWKPIPFPDSRKMEMAAYAREHYRLDTFRLEHPQVIVEHFTATPSFRVAYNTFASNAPDLGQLPGTCAHFLIDADGTIYQLVPLDLMCRHTVGLNWTAIGIEMVGLSDQQILGRARQMAAATRLTLWLMQRFGIQLRNVIGHNESLTSALHRELVPSFRCQTHADWSHADMEVFRGILSRLAGRYGVGLGPSARPVSSGC